MQRPGLRAEVFALFEDIGDVVAAEGLELEGVFDGAGDFVGAIDFAQRYDFGDVLMGVKAALFYLVEILFSTRAEGIEAQQQFGVAGCMALLEQLLDVVRIFNVLVTVVVTGVGGD